MGGWASAGGGDVVVAVGSGASVAFPRIVSMTLRSAWAWAERCKEMPMSVRPTASSTAGRVSLMMLDQHKLSA